MAETTFHSFFLSPSNGPQQVLRLDDCRRWVNIIAEVGDLIVEVSSRKEKDQSGWAKLPSEDPFQFWLEAGQELWVRVRLVDVWPGPDVVGNVIGPGNQPPLMVLAPGPGPGPQPQVAEPTGWISLVVCRDAG